MRISGGSQPFKGPNEVKLKTDKMEKTTTSKGAGSSKAVHISSMASELASLENEMKNVPDIRADKVEALKQQIESGEYKVDVDKLADVLSNLL